MTDSETIARIQRQLDLLSDWREDINTQRAAEAVRMDHIDKQLQTITKGINKLVMLVATGVVGAFVAWVISGGLAVVGS